jgi:actin-related protein
VKNLHTLTSRVLVLCSYVKVTDFKVVPSLVRYALKDILHCKPEEHPILVTEPAWNTTANRERMAEIMFEEFQVPAFYIANTGVLNASVVFFFFWAGNCL